VTEEALRRGRHASGRSLTSPPPPLPYPLQGALLVLIGGGSCIPAPSPPSLSSTPPPPPLSQSRAEKDKKNVSAREEGARLPASAMVVSFDSLLRIESVRNWTAQFRIFIFDSSSANKKICAFQTDSFFKTRGAALQSLFIEIALSVSNCLFSV
jgi:hypothetical protein